MKEGGLFGESACHLDEKQQKYSKSDKPLQWFMILILYLRWNAWLAAGGVCPSRWTIEKNYTANLDSTLKI